MSTQQFGKTFKGEDRFKTRHFREYAISFEDMPIWAVGSFIELLHEQTEGMIVEKATVSVGVKVRTCTVSEFDDVDIRRLEEALAEKFIDGETVLVRQSEAPSLAQEDAGP